MLPTEPEFIRAASVAVIGFIVCTPTVKSIGIRTTFEKSVFFMAGVNCIFSATMRPVADPTRAAAATPTMFLLLPNFIALFRMNELCIITTSLENDVVISLVLFNTPQKMKPNDANDDVVGRVDVNDTLNDYSD